MKALKMGIIRGQHARGRAEFADRGVGGLRDGYTASQIPDLTHSTWSLALGEKSVDQSFRTWVDFLFANTMLMRLANRLPLELPDLLMCPMPKEGRRGTGWCLVAVMDQSKSLPPCFCWLLTVL